VCENIEFTIPEVKLALNSLKEMIFDRTILCCFVMIFLPFFAVVASYEADTFVPSPLHGQQTVESTRSCSGVIVRACLVDGYRRLDEARVKSVVVCSSLSECRRCIIDVDASHCPLLTEQTPAAAAAADAR